MEYWLFQGVEGVGRKQLEPFVYSFIRICGFWSDCFRMVNSGDCCSTATLRALMAHGQGTDGL